MDKYIDAEQLKQTVETSMDMQDLYLPSHFIDVINGIPAADVAPIRRGRWTDHSDEWDGGYYECSVCGEAFTFIEGTPKENLYNYCPNCGAKMEATE